MNRKYIQICSFCIFILINIKIFEIMTSVSGGYLLIEIIIACCSFMIFIETFRGKDNEF